MSTPDLPTFVKYEGDGVATQFTITFPYQRKEYIKVYLARKGETKDTLLENNQFSFESETVIKFPILDTDAVLGEGDTLVIQRETQLGSPYTFDNQRRLFPEEVMNADDLAFQQIQELKDAERRAVKAPLTSDDLPEEMWEQFNKGVTAANDAAARAKVSEDKATAAANDPNVVAVGEDLRKGDESSIKKASEDLANIDTVADHIDNVDRVARSARNVDVVATHIDNVDTVATNQAQVNTVAGHIDNVDTVAGIADNIVAVDENKDNINAVAGDLENIDIVAEHINDVDTVSDNIGNVNVVAQNIDQVNPVGQYIDDVRNVSNSIYDVNKVADNIEYVVNVLNNIDNVNTVAEDRTNIDTVAEHIDNVDVVAYNMSIVQQVSYNMDAVASAKEAVDRLEEVKDLADAITDVSQNMDDVLAANERAAAAAASAAEALASQQAAANSELQAAGSEAAASASEQAAKESEDAANASKEAAAASATEASGYVEEAKKWAIGEITEREEGSAKYWAEQAKQGSINVATTEQALAGEADDCAMTPLKTKQVIDEREKAYAKLNEPNTFTADVIVPDITEASDEGSAVNKKYITTEIESKLTDLEGTVNETITQQLAEVTSQIEALDTKVNEDIDTKVGALETKLSTEYVTLATEQTITGKKTITSELHFKNGENEDFVINQGETGDAYISNLGGGLNLEGVVGNVTITTPDSEAAGKEVVNAQWVKDFVGSPSSGGSGGIAPSCITEKSITISGTTVSLSWKDPRDTVIDGLVLAIWKSTLVVKKKGSYPENASDGTVVGTSTTRDAYYNTPLTDTQEDAASWYYRAFPLSTGNVYGIDERNCFGRDVFGYRIDKNDPVPETRVSYLTDCDNAGYEPCKMDFTADKFGWGSWKKAFFIPKPCALTYAGTVDYYLNPDDFTKKSDGGESDVASDVYGGNFMCEFPNIFVKFYDEDSYTYVYISNQKIDDGYECWATKKSDGSYTGKFYMPMFEGTKDAENRLRSYASTGKPTASTNAEAEATYAHANGANWETTTWAQELLMMLLFPLLFKSTNSQVALGYGASGSSSGLTCNNNAAVSKGLMYGTSAGSATGLNYLGMHNWWGHRWRRCNGLMNNKGKYVFKLTPHTGDGSTVAEYNRTGEGYIDSGIVPPTASESYIARYQSVQKLGFVPQTTTGASSTTYFCDGMWTNNGQLDQLQLGGGVYHGALDGVFCFDVNDAPSHTYWYNGASVSYTPF